MTLIAATYTPAGIQSGTVTANDPLTSGRYTGGNEPIETIVDYYLLNQDGSYILNMDGSRIIIYSSIIDSVRGDGLTSATYTAGDMV